MFRERLERELVLIAKVLCVLNAAALVIATVVAIYNLDTVAVVAELHPTLQLGLLLSVSFSLSVTSVVVVFRPKCGCPPNGDDLHRPISGV